MQIAIDCDFPGGGVDAVRFVDARTVEFEAPLDSGKQSLWFCFRVRGARGSTLRFRQTGLEHVLGIHESRGYAPVCPVCRRGSGDWERLDPRNVAFSADPLSFSFVHEFSDDETYFAFCYPYTFQDFSAYLARRASPRMRLEPLGKSDGGRDFPCVTVGYPERAEVRNLVVLIARQHAGEVPGSYVLEGVLDALASGSAEAEKLLDTTLFLAFPFADIDCVETGRYGKGQYPADYNRDWSLSPCHQGTRLMQEAIRRLSGRHKLNCVIDLHAPQPGAASYFVPNPESPCEGEAWLRYWEFAQAFEDACRGRQLFRLDDLDPNFLNWSAAHGKTMCASYFYRMYGAVAFTAEFSYHRDGDGELLSREDWRGFGSLLVETYAKSSMNRDGSLPAVDRARIPAWTIPERPGGWEKLDQPKNMAILVDEDGIRLRPLSEANEAWLCCPFRFGAGTGVLRLESGSDFCADLHRTYYRDSTALGNGRLDCRCFEAGEHRISFSSMELPGDVWTVSLRLRNLRTELRLSANGSGA